MKVLIIGANGFIGKNLSLWLERDNLELLKIDVDNLDRLEEYVLAADFIIELAGVNRPKTNKEFKPGNLKPVRQLISILKKNKKRTPILYSSSVQADWDNDYGNAKKVVEDLLFKLASTNKNPVYVYRFNNVFGKWCKPNYNSVIATFCYNQTHGIENIMDNPAKRIRFVYIDDLCKHVLSTIRLDKWLGSEGILTVPIYYDVSLGHIDWLTRLYKESIKSKMLPIQRDDFEKKLYATFLSYVEEDKFIFDLETHKNDLGSFTEVTRSENAGQMSVNIIKPGVSKGGHYHNTKSERYYVAKGECLVKFRRLDSDKIIEFKLSEDKPQTLIIPIGYTHSITNIGKEEAVVLMWASENYDENNPDTIPEEL